MKGIILIVIACLLWAIDTLFRYPLLSSGVSATRIVFSEHLILFLIFIPVVFKSRQKFWNGKVSHLFYFFMIGCLGSALATLCFTKAFYLINPSLVILLQKFQPLIAILLARVIIGEKLSRNFLLWGLICIFGAFLITYQDIVPGIAKLDFSVELLSSKNLVGYFYTFIAILGWGSATVFGKKLIIAGYNEKEVMGGRFIFGFLFLIPIVLLSRVELDFDPRIWSTISVMVLITGLISMYLYYKGLKIISAKLCTLIEMSFPLFAVIVNWIFLDKSLEVQQILGGIVLLLGSTVIQLKKY